MYLKNNIKLNPAAVYVDAAGTQYPPASWQSRLVELDINQVADPIRPDDTYYIVTENADGSYGSTLRPITERRAAKWTEIKAFRDNMKLSGGYKVNISGVDKWFHSDEFSRIQQIGLTLLGAGANGIQWRTMDGTFVTLSQASAGQIFTAAAAFDQAVFGNAETHRLTMEASATPESYDFSTGWPQVFA